MHKIKWMLLGLLPLLLTGCWDGRDPEDRAYVITMGIDQTAEGLSFTLLPAKTTSQTPQAYQVTAETLAGAVAQTDSHSSREVYLGQLKTVVFGQSLLADATALDGVLAELERGTAVSDKVMVLGSAGSAADCVRAIGETDGATGLFLWEFYKNTAKEVAVTRGMDLDTLLTDLRVQKGNVILPRMETREEGLTLAGGIALADGAYAFALSSEMEQAHLLLLEEGIGAVWEGEYQGESIPMEIRKNQVSYHAIVEEDGTADCRISLELSGALVGGTQKVMESSQRRALENFFADIIKTDLENTIKEVQEITSADVFGIGAAIQRQMGKTEFAVQDWQNWEISVDCRINLQDTGRMR